MRLIDFNENKNHLISLEELDNSGRELLNGEKYQNGMRHADLIAQLILAINLAGYEASFKTCYVSSGGSKTFSGASMEKERAIKYGERAVESYIFRRLIALIEIPNFGDAETVTSVALSYHQQGVQIAMGPNVRICSNMSIMSPQFSISTYGRDDKVSDLTKIISIFKSWMGNMPYIRERDKAIMGEMKNRIVNHNDIISLIGDMSVRRVERDVFLKKYDYGIPLTQSQISKFCESYIGFREQHKGDHFPLWDIYNLGTELHKPEFTDMVNIVDQNVAFSMLISDYFGINTVYDINARKEAPIQERETFVDAVIVEPEPIVANNDVIGSDEW